MEKWSEGDKANITAQCYHQLRKVLKGAVSQLIKFSNSGNCH